MTGSFIPSESGGTRSRAGGMSVSLAGPDGRVFGGGLAGLFIAAGPVQVYNLEQEVLISLMDLSFCIVISIVVIEPIYIVQVMVGSFIAGQEESQQQQQIKKQRRERLGIPPTTQASNISFGGSAEDPKARYGLNKPVVIQPPPVSAPAVSFSHEPSTNTVHGYYANNTANHIKDLFSSFPGEDEEEDEEELEGEDDEEFGGHSESDTEVPS